MKRKCYDSYDYIDPDNLYTYLGSSVLRNKHASLNIV
ncbi:filamentation induced by cAMP protein fic [Streptococcus pneumoniae]|nr:filamentation induced by cAMP protein fic [Streptococcus pneumoniae]VKL80388.1 filamentation induced by cAMP protein fic [Streptococcus pneumoniae]